ncbi:2171_t:CDS:2 [Cetraspora pellucida]|uniref:2171_t:CDS:1 n=1 Tax=Cetraspora pellucida TaxID=1433469 RepID=A0A9N9B8P7_9GLOM|nr:2171_t:CDS:2 [Cetraspora pellucida]
MRTTIVIKLELSWIVVSQALTQVLGIITSSEYSLKKFNNDNQVDSLVE